MRIYRLVSSLAKTTTTKWNRGDALPNLARQSRPFASVARDAAAIRPLPELERALQLADKIVGNSANRAYNLQYVLNEEVSVVTQILRKLVGTNHSLTEVEKQYQNGHHSDQFVRGLSVLLISKAGAVSNATSETSTAKEQNEAALWQGQLVLAKVVEMINMAMIIHKEICNIDSAAITQTVEGSALHLSNKISVLYGDFLWAKAWKDLADLHQIEVTDMMVSVLVNTTQGQFVSEQELNEVTSKLNLEYWLEKNFLLSACLPAFGCKSVLKLAQIDESLQSHGYQFGQNLGYFLKAHQEINWFLNQSPNSRDYLDFCSLPVVMHSLETGEPLEHLSKSATEQSPKLPKYNYAQLHSLIRTGAGIAKSRTVLEMLRANAFTNLNHFPDSEARDCLKKILSAMNV